MENEIMEINQEISENANANVIDNLRSAFAVAQIMCRAAIIPDSYRNKPADCMIATRP